MSQPGYTAAPTEEKVPLQSPPAYNPGHPEQQTYPPPQQGYPQQQGYPPQQQGYPPQQQGYPPQQGYPQGYAPAPQQGYPNPSTAPPTVTYVQTKTVQDSPPQDQGKIICLIVLSVFTTLCCNWICGIPAIVVSVIAFGSYDNSKRQSWSKVSIILNVIAILFGLIFIGIFIWYYFFVMSQINDVDGWNFDFSSSSSSSDNYNWNDWSSSSSSSWNYN